MTYLNPNKNKILESILFLIQKAEDDARPITQYQIVKAIFIGDLYHLRKYGRPISFDNYSALEFGPAPETTYDMLKPDYDGRAEFGDEWPLWVTSPIAGGTRKARQYHGVKRSFNSGRLSLTDVEELASAYEMVKQLGFDGVVDFTHQLPAYKQAWDSRGHKKSNRMKYELLFDDGDNELVEELAYASKYI